LLEFTVLQYHASNNFLFIQFTVFIIHKLVNSYLYQEGYSFIDVCLFVSRIVQKLLNRFSRRKGSTWTTEETIRF